MWCYHRRFYYIKNVAYTSEAVTRFQIKINSMDFIFLTYCVFYIVTNRIFFFLETFSCVFKNNIDKDAYQCINCFLDSAYCILALILLLFHKTFIDHQSWTLINSCHKFDPSGKLIGLVAGFEVSSGRLLE